MKSSRRAKESLNSTPSRSASHASSRSKGTPLEETLIRRNFNSLSHDSSTSLILNLFLELQELTISLAQETEIYQFFMTLESSLQNLFPDSTVCVWQCVSDRENQDSNAIRPSTGDTRYDNPGDLQTFHHSGEDGVTVATLIIGENLAYIDFEFHNILLPSLWHLLIDFGNRLAPIISHLNQTLPFSLTKLFEHATNLANAPNQKAVEFELSRIASLINAESLIPVSVAQNVPSFSKAHQSLRTLWNQNLPELQKGHSISTGDILIWPVLNEQKTIRSALIVTSQHDLPFSSQIFVAVSLVAPLIKYKPIKPNTSAISDTSTSDLSKFAKSIEKIATGEGKRVTSAECVAHAVQAAGAKSGSLLLLDNEKKTLKCVVSIGGTPKFSISAKIEPYREAVEQHSLIMESKYTLVPVYGNEGVIGLIQIDKKVDSSVIPEIKVFSALCGCAATMVNFERSSKLLGKLDEITEQMSTKGLDAACTILGSIKEIQKLSLKERPTDLKIKGSKARIPFGTNCLSLKFKYKMSQEIEQLLRIFSRLKPALFDPTDIEITDDDKKASFDQFPLDVISLGRQGQIQLATYIFTEFNLFEEFRIDFPTWCNFMNQLVIRYRNNPYHNFSHVCDVLHSIYTMLIKLDRFIVHVTPTEKLAMCIGALCHDLAHVGIGNKALQQIGEQHAVLFQGHSILEYFHQSQMLGLLDLDDCNIVKHLNAADRKTFWRIAYHLIAMTDLARHSEVEEQWNSLPGRETGEYDWEDPNSRLAALTMIFTAADISNPGQQFEVGMKWSKGVIDETKREFRLLKEVTGTCGTLKPLAAFTLGFIKFFPLPHFHQLVSVFGQLKEIEDAILNAQDRWQELVATK